FCAFWIFSSTSLSERCAPWRGVPATERYSVHKLTVAQRRLTDKDGTAKSQKDLMQAAPLMSALIELRQTADLADVYAEACNRGPTWRDLIFKSLGSLSSADAGVIIPALVSELKRIGLEPAVYGFAERSLRVMLGAF
ncbi:hypothetical protein DK26_28300, partial [Bosea sp. WAO]|uniref:GSU2403 family nucleotidyltransferase fold protein n=1 Tax=Bosea sp. WAO TaxID=406341 RepID=UPI0007483B04